MASNKFPCEVTYIECGVCNERILKKNFDRHFKNQHPTVSATEKRPASQRSIFKALFGNTEKRLSTDSNDDES